MQTDLTQALSLRCRIARLGEKDVFGWWDSEASSPNGQYFLQLLFPKTGLWTGLEMAMAAARVRHSALIPKVRAVHLFDLGPAAERSLEGLLRRLKVERADATPFATLPETSNGEVRPALEAMGVSIGEFGPDAQTSSTGSVCVGEITTKDLAEPARLARRLASAYVCSQKGRLVAPYLRLVGHND